MAKHPKRPPFIVPTLEVPEMAPHYPESDETLAYARAIGKAAGLQRIGLHVERLPPGHRTSWPHAEEKEEEFVFVLKGEVDAWIDGTLHRMKAGDLAAFPAGTGMCHTVINNGKRGALLLVGGERTKPDNRIFYPQHPGRLDQMPWSHWWEDIPLRPQGPHDGMPTTLRVAERARARQEQREAEKAEKAAKARAERAARAKAEKAEKAARAKAEEADKAEKAKAKKARKRKPRT